MRVLAIVFVPALGLLTTGCGNEPPRAASFLQEDDAERAKVLADCRTGAHRGDECANAGEAERLVKEARRSQERRQQVESWITR